ncbi:T9SS type B sorting domain-containing protein [Soonwooa sp.]|uniref:T9SS type B sorting domain-containing protein n=1 Tax=Soonwooa sp. TaxID=1938592 RepID=UPI00260ED8FA|nr:T9SS type B sorting domain-containing protein [Soonwooa sp.]
MKKKLLLFNLFFVLLCIKFSGQATVWYVSPSGSGNQSGSNWQNTKTLQAAFADFTSGAYELRLLRGTYNINSTLKMEHGYTVNMLGGYSGNGTDRDYGLYPSILNGQKKTQILEINSDGNSVNGLTMKDGYVTGENGGGAIIFQSNSVNIYNITFVNNVSDGSRGAGALFLMHGSGGIINIGHCTFEGNRSNYINYPHGQNGGGAIHNWAQNANIFNCTFRNNYTENKGAAIYTWGSNLKITNCGFEMNTAEKDGGAIYVNSNDVLITGSSFLKNKSLQNGGAIFNSDFLDISYTTFQSNQSGIDGGAIFNAKSMYNRVTKIDKVGFIYNSASKGGGIFTATSDGIKIISSLFQSNKATDIGGAIFNNEFMEVTNSTFVLNSNTAVIIPSYAKTNYYNNTTNIFNSIFSENTAKQGGYREDINSQITNTDLSTKDIRRNILQTYNQGIDNLVGIDPLLVSSSSNASLQSNSPAIDYGQNTLYSQVSGQNPSTAQDLQEASRLSGTSIDLGAYEFQQRPVTNVPTCSTITFPTNNATNISINPNITWTTSSGATGYRIRIGTSAGGSDILNQNLGNVTSFTLPTSLNYNTTYFVRIIPFNSAGDAIGCTENKFTTENGPIIVPTCTIITFPTNNATNISINPNITWTTSSGATGYRIRIGTTAGGSDILNQNLGNVTNFALPTNLNYNTTYFVRIIPFNSAGDAIGCTENKFTTENVPIIVPTCTIITFPANNATNISINPTITWTASSDAAGYRIRIGTTAGGSDIINQNLGNVTSFTFPTNLNYNTTYFVRVIPFNSAGDAIACPENKFTTEGAPITVPTCSTITFPTNNATNVAINPTITWTTSSSATGYRIRIGTTAGGSDILNQNLGNLTSFALPTNLNYNTTYFVRVIPFNSAGDAIGCAKNRFTTEAAPITIPNCTTITFPTNNATNVSINPTITWTASPGATGYSIRVGTTAGGNDIINQDLGNATSFTLPTSLNYNSTYFVRIIPFNSAGDATGCTEHRFTTEKETIEEHKIPNVFTPNNDGTNDVIDFSFLLNRKNARLQIVDRYGTLHFEGNQNNQFIWNGTHNGLKSKTGTYWYIIIWTNAEEKIVTQKGWILLKSN